MKANELTASVLKQDLVVQAQAQLRHPRQKDAHLNGAHDLTAKHIPVGAHLWRKARSVGHQGRREGMWGLFCFLMCREGEGTEYSGTKQKAPYQKINRLDDVQEDLVFPVLDALRPPRYGIGDSGRGARCPRV